MTAVTSIGTAAIEHRQDGALVIRLAGPRQLRGSLPSLAGLERELDTLGLPRAKPGGYTSVRYGFPDGSVRSSFFASSCDMLGRPAVMCRAR